MNNHAADILDDMNSLHYDQCEFIIRNVNYHKYCEFEKNNPNEYEKALFFKDLANWTISLFYNILMNKHNFTDDYINQKIEEFKIRARFKDDN